MKDDRDKDSGVAWTTGGLPPGRNLSPVGPEPDNDAAGDHSVKIYSRASGENRNSGEHSQDFILASPWIFHNAGIP